MSEQLQAGQPKRCYDSGGEPGTETGTSSSQTSDTQLRTLCSKLLCAKKVEEQAKAARTSIESAIAELVPGPTNGQKTRTFEDGVKVTVKRKLLYCANVIEIEKAVASVSKRIGKEIPVPVESKTTRTLDVKGYEWFRSNAPDMFNLISKHVTVKPGKDAVTIKIPDAGVASD